MKTYLSRRDSRFWAAELPVGDPFGGAAYGEFNDPATIATTIGAQVVGSVISSGAASDAASQQVNAANNATATQQQTFNTVNAQGAPYRTAGANALGAIATGFGAPQASAPSGPLTADQVTQLYQHYLGRAPSQEEIASQLASGNTAQSMDSTFSTSPEYQARVAAGNSPVNSLYAGGASDANGITPGQFTHQFGASDLNANMSPAYGFQLDQGQRTLNNTNNLTGGMVGGNALQGLQKFTQDYAQTAYQNAFSNYTTNQNNIFNRLSTIAGIGKDTVTGLAGPSSNLATGIAGSQVGAGQAQASGTVGASNAISGGLSNAAGYYTLSNLINPSGGGSNVQVPSTGYATP